MDALLETERADTNRRVRFDADPGAEEALHRRRFSRVRTYVGARGHYRSIPTPVLISCDRFLSWLPSAARKAIIRRLPLGALLNVRLVGIK